MPLPDDQTPKKKLASSKEKYIVIDFDANEVTTHPSLKEVKEQIQFRTDNEDRGADWAVNNFMVYAVKEQIIFTAKEKISINFGIG